MSSAQPKAKLAALVEKIKEQTDQGKLLWEATIDEGVFQTSLADYSVKISKVPSRNIGKMRVGSFVYDDDYRISIHNQEGATLEEVTDSQLDESVGSTYFIAMESIYKSARRSALGVDQAIDTILESLGKGE